MNLSPQKFSVSFIDLVDPLFCLSFVLSYSVLFFLFHFSNFEIRILTFLFLPSPSTAPSAQEPKAIYDKANNADWNSERIQSKRNKKDKRKYEKTAKTFSSITSTLNAFIHN